MIALSTPSGPKPATYYIEQAEQVADKLSVAYASGDLAGAAWWAAIATANALIAIALQAGVPNGALHQPLRGAAAGGPQQAAQAQQDAQAS